MEKFIVRKSESKTILKVVEAADPIEAVYLAHKGDGEVVETIDHNNNGSLECVGTVAEFEYMKETQSKAGTEMAQLSPVALNSKNRATLYCG